jgi:GR25 family glycosyltransferase involved in LPS biosynthesis
MIKSIHKQTIIVICVYILVLITLHLIKVYSNKFKPNIHTIHVINLDSDSERWNNIKKLTTHTVPPVERWTAVNGKELTQNDMAIRGVGYAMTRSGKGPYSEQGNDLRNQGVVGCFLSHKTLLERLSMLDVPDYYGHLILEDDVIIPDDFLKEDDAWSSTYTKIPFDWDIVYLDMVNPVGESIGNNIMRLKYKAGPGGGNWGTHAYIVRHGAIKDKILPWLEYMVDTIDEQYKRKFNSWKVYAVVPGIIKLDPVLSSPENSSIQKKA